MRAPIQLGMLLVALVFAGCGGGSSPAAPTGLNATPGDGQVVLTWTASAGATSYHVKRGAAAGGPYAQVGAPTDTTFTNTELTNGTPYYYVVTASNIAGESGPSAPASATPKVAQVAGAPRILYTDIVAGSTTGGENNKGAYLSIFGKGFGSAGLGTTVKVTINQVEVDNYRYLGPSKGRPDIQQITVQTGALGNPTPGAPLAIRVVVVGVASNADLTFTVQPGGFLFVDPINGNDAAAVKNDIQHPWQHVQSSAGFLTGALGFAAAGDTIVLRGGSYTGDGYDDYWLKFRNITGSAPTGAAGHGYLAVLAYPGETVSIHPSSASNFGVISGGGSAYQASYIVIADLVVQGGSPGNTTFHDGPVNLQVLSDYWRVVNNNLSCPDAPYDAKAGGIAGNGRYDAFLGNTIHDTGEDQSNSNEENHGIYIDAGNDYEIAYNVVRNIPGGSAIQFFNSSDATPTIFNVKVHHNLITNVTAPHGKHGINIADTSSTGFEITDNVISHVSRGGIRLNTTDIQGAKIYNNTLYDVASIGRSPLYAAIMSDANLPSGALDLQNNIVWPASGVAYLGGSCGIDGSSGTFSHNLWFGGSEAAPAFDAGAVTGDPLFSAGAQDDFHLSSGSAAEDHGAAVVSPWVIDDFDLIARPQGNGYDIGAFERMHNP